LTISSLEYETEAYNTILQKRTNKGSFNKSGQNYVKIKIWISYSI